MLYRVALAQTRHTQQSPPPLSQYVHCLFEAGLEESDVIGDFSMGRKPGAEGLSSSTSYEPDLYFNLKPEVCENHGSDITHLYTNPKTGVVTDSEIPAVPIPYPPPRIVIVDCNNSIHIRDLQKLGDFCRHCCGAAGQMSKVPA